MCVLGAQLPAHCRLAQGERSPGLVTPLGWSLAALPAGVLLSVTSVVDLAMLLCP